MPSWAIALRLVGVGWFLAASVIIGIVAGLFLDEWLGTKVIFTLLGVLVGITVAFYGLYQMVKPLMDFNDKESDKE
jgi:F0F1-type ATP synthase assembly protein I